MLLPSAVAPLVLPGAFRDEPETYAISAAAEGIEGRSVRLSITDPSPRVGRCAACASDLNRSRVRWWERVYEMCTTKRPYRCSRCQRRAWLDLPRQSAMVAESDVPADNPDIDAPIGHGGTHERRASARHPFPKPMPPSFAPRLRGLKDRLVVSGRRASFIGGAAAEHPSATRVASRGKDHA